MIQLIPVDIRNSIQLMFNQQDTYCQQNQLQTIHKTQNKSSPGNSYSSTHIIKFTHI